MNETFKILAKIDNSNLDDIIKSAGIQPDNPSLSFYRAVYANVSGIPNKNKVALASSVKKDVPQLTGCQANWEHYRRGYVAGSIIYAFVNDNDEIEIVFSIYKTIYEAENERLSEMVKSGDANVSFELKVDAKDVINGSNGVRTIKHCQWEGVGILLDNPPAYPSAHVYEQADLDALREQDLVFAKMLKDNQKVQEPIIEQFEGSHWTAKYINQLPDSCFAVIEPAYLEGKTTDKRARHLPFKNYEGNVNDTHYRFALRKIDKLQAITDSITNEELITKAQVVLDSVNLSFNKEENTVDKKVNDELLAKLKESVVAEFGGEVVKDWTDADYTDEKIQALRESLNKVEDEKPAEEPEKAEEKPSEEKAEVTEETAETKEVTKQNRVYEVVYKDDGSMEVVETTMEEVEVDGEKKMEEKIVRHTVYASEKVDAMKAEYDAKIAEKDAVIVAKDAEIIKIKESALNVAKLRIELGDFAKDLSDEDLMNADKVEIAKLKKENATLKASKGSTTEEVTATVVEPENTDEKNVPLETGAEVTVDDGEEKADVKGYLKAQHKKYRKN